MKVDKNTQFVESIVYNDKLINVYIDDAGQTYLLEYVDDQGNLKEIGCGSYNTDYKWCIDELFGNPELNCPIYKLKEGEVKNQECLQKFKYGYCDGCKYADFYFWGKKQLINLGIIDPRLQIQNTHLEQLFIDIAKENFDNKG